MNKEISRAASPSIVLRVKKRFKGAIFALALGAVIPATTQAIDLENPHACSSGVLNMMSGFGLQAYSVANFFNGFCRSIPFFGSFCPNLDAIAGSFFSQILKSPNLTLEMMACANSNSGMLSFMIHVMDQNPYLLDQVGYYMSQTGDGYTQGCELGEALTQMALNHNNMKNFLFAKINNNLYQSLSAGMQCKNNTVVNVTKLLDQNAEQVLGGSTPFTRAFVNLGTPEDNNDGNEIATEEVFTAVFSNVTAATYFMSALSKVDEEAQKGMLDLMFLGEVPIPARYCNWWDYQCVPREASVEVHGNQAYLNMYAAIKGFTQGVLPAYDLSLPPVPDSSNPANAILGKMFQLTVDGTNINDYGISFFKAITSGTRVHQWQPAMDVNVFMFNLTVKGDGPISIGQFFALLPILNDANSTVPRELAIADTGGDGVSDDDSNSGDTNDPAPVVNTPPSIAIDTPSNGSYTTSGEMNEFQATASDNEDGMLDESVEWSSSVDGFLAKGAIINAILVTPGEHVITAKVTDSDGAVTETSVNVTVNKVIRQDVASSATLSASSRYSSYYKAAYAADNNLSSYWSSDSISYWEPHDETLQMSWNAIQEIEDVIIHWHNNYKPSQFSIYADVNGVRTNMTGSMTATGSSQTISINVNASSIYIVLGAPESSSFVAIREIEVR